ncbi:hypothetical protein Aph02nite_06540 [Actinoplanes philippinensis]|nr:hypothetical protein Aph02nite_06540 [Actinoplanes philippinensis]
MLSTYWPRIQIVETLMNTPNTTHTVTSEAPARADPSRTVMATANATVRRTDPRASSTTVTSGLRSAGFRRRSHPGTTGEIGLLRGTPPAVGDSAEWRILPSVRVIHERRTVSP